MWRVSGPSSSTGSPTTRGPWPGLKERGWTPGRSLEIPQGPCSSFRSPGGHRIALYQLTRPQVIGHFEGRRDF